MTRRVAVIVSAISFLSFFAFAEQGMAASKSNGCSAWSNGGNFNSGCLATTEDSANDVLKKIWMRVAADTKIADAMRSEGAPRYPKLLSEQAAWLKFANIACNYYLDEDASELARANASDCRVAAINARIKQLKDFDDFVKDGG